MKSKFRMGILAALTACVLHVGTVQAHSRWETIVPSGPPDPIEGRSSYYTGSYFNDIGQRDALSFNVTQEWAYNSSPSVGDLYAAAAAHDAVLAQNAPPPPAVVFDADGSFFAKLRDAIAGTGTQLFGGLFAFVSDIYSFAFNRSQGGAPDGNAVKSILQPDGTTTETRTYCADAGVCEIVVDTKNAQGAVIRHQVVSTNPQ
jgi:hypothetical protein